MRPFDYVRLWTGDYACVMWHNATCDRVVAYPWYQPSTVRDDSTVRLDGRDLRKIYRKGHRAKLDERIQTGYARFAVEDPIGGAMIRLEPDLLERHFDGAEHLGSVLRTATPVDLRPLLDLLRLSPEAVSTTGSWLVGAARPSDLDFVVHDPIRAAETAQVIRRLLRTGTVGRLPGYWGRPFHHRRFIFAGWKICIRCPPPVALVTEYIHGATCAGTAPEASCTVVDASMGHCTPSIYAVGMSATGPHWSSGEVLPLLSSDGSHAFAFENGERLRLSDVRMYSSSRHQIFLVCHLGYPDGIVPHAGER